MKKTLIYPAGHPAPRGAYSPGLLVEHGGASTLYLTGQLAVDPEGNVVAPYDATAQTEYVFRLIGAILKAAGMDFGDVVNTRRPGTFKIRRKVDGTSLSQQDANATNFNAMPRPATLLVTGDQAEIVKRAETIEDVFKRDVIPERLARK